MGKKNKNKNRYEDMWDTSYEQQQKMIRDVDNFIKGKGQIQIDGDDDDSTMLGEDVFQKAIDKAFNTKFINNDNSYNDTYEYDTDNEFVYTEESKDNSYYCRTISLSVDEELNQVFIEDGNERIGYCCEYDIGDFESNSVSNMSKVGSSVIDLLINNMTPLAVVEDIKVLTNKLNAANVIKYNIHKFYIIFDEELNLYKCYVIDIDSLREVLQFIGKDKTYKRLVSIAIHAYDSQNNSSEYKMKYFINSKYNELDLFIANILKDDSTVINENYRGYDISKNNLVVSLYDVYKSISVIMEAAFPDSDDEDDDMEDETLQDKYLDLEIEDYKHTFLPEDSGDEEDDNLFDEDDTEPVEIDISSLKEQMEKSSIQPIDKIEVEEEVKPVVKEPEKPIVVNNVKSEDIDFDDLESIPVIRKPRKN